MISNTQNYAFSSIQFNIEENDRTQQIFQASASNPPQGTDITNIGITRWIEILQEAQDNDKSLATGLGGCHDVLVLNEDETAQLNSNLPLDQRERQSYKLMIPQTIKEYSKQFLDLAAMDEGTSDEDYAAHVQTLSYLVPDLHRKENRAQDLLLINQHLDELREHVDTPENLGVIGGILHQISTIFKGQKHRVKGIVIDQGPSLDFKDKITQDDGTKQIHQFAKDAARSASFVVEDPQNMYTTTSQALLMGSGPERTAQLTAQIKDLLVTEEDQRWELAIQSVVNQTILNAIGMTLKGKLTIKLLTEAEEAARWTVGGEDYVLSAEFPDGNPPVKLHLQKDAHGNFNSIKVEVDTSINLIQKRVKSEQAYLSDFVQVVVPDALRCRVEYIITIDNEGAPVVDNKSVFMEASVNDRFPALDTYPQGADIHMIDIDRWSAILDEVMSQPRQFVVQLSESDHEIFIWDQAKIDLQNNLLPEDVKDPDIENVKFNKSSLAHLRQITRNFLEKAAVNEGITTEQFKHHVINLSDKIADIEYADLTTWQAFWSTTGKVAAITGACFLFLLILTIPLGIWILHKINTAHYLTPTDKKVVKARQEVA